MFQLPPERSRDPRQGDTLTTTTSRVPGSRGNMVRRNVQLTVSLFDERRGDLGAPAPQTAISLSFRGSDGSETRAMARMNGATATLPQQSIPRQGIVVVTVLAQPFLQGEVHYNANQPNMGLRVIQAVRSGTDRSGESETRSRSRSTEGGLSAERGGLNATASHNVTDTEEHGRTRERERAGESERQRLDVTVVS